MSCNWVSIYLQNIIIIFFHILVLLILIINNTQKEQRKFGLAKIVVMKYLMEANIVVSAMESTKEKTGTI